MKKTLQISGFTLVEILITITILSIIMISVMILFTNSTNLSMKVDINRAIQENIKNMVEDMAESVRKNGINICSSGGSDCYDMSLATGKYYTATTLYTGTHQYYLGRQTTTGGWIQVTNVADCAPIGVMCALLKDGAHPLSNQNVAIRDVKFYISNDAIPKVTLNLTVESSPKRGVKITQREQNTLYFQTTLSQRIINED